jgi:hypothetical protein
MALTKFNYNSFDLTTAASKGLAFNSSANGFETSSAGSMTLIKTLTASSSSTLSFVDGSSSVVLDNTYPVYVFKFINIHGATKHAHFTFNMSTDSGSNYNVTKTTTYFHAANNEGDSATEVAYQTPSDLAQSTDFHRLTNFLNIQNDGSCSGTLTLFNPSSTTFVKHFISTSNSMSYTSDPYSLNPFTAGYGNTTSTVDAIQFKMSSGNIDAGTIKLYGIKDS